MNYNARNTYYQPVTLGQFLPVRRIIVQVWPNNNNAEERAEELVKTFSQYEKVIGHAWMIYTNLTDNELTEIFGNKDEIETWDLDADIHIECDDD